MGNSPATTRKRHPISTIETAITKSTSCRFDNKEDVTLIWLDETIDTTRTTLREIIDYVLLYTELEPCIKSIRAINHERIFLVLSCNYAEQCLEEIHDLKQVHSVFIFCINVSSFKSQHIDIERFSKLIGIYDDEDQLIESIRIEFDIFHKQLSTFSFYEQQQFNGNLSKQSASFLWFQLFKRILFYMPRYHDAKQDILKMCQEYYHGNSEELKNIDFFNRNYTSEDAIRWHTKQSFIHRLSHKALRMKDIELLYTFRYYIQDLCTNLSNEHRNFQKKTFTDSILTFYCGFKLTRNELTDFQSHIGSLISANGFLSTTRNYDLAIKFALKIAHRTADTLPVLFKIQVNINLNDVVFADISLLSIYPEEEEVLFDIGSVFKIDQIYFNEQQNIWNVCLKLTNEGQYIIEKYIETNRFGSDNKDSILLTFGSLFTEMEEYDHGEIYFDKLLSSNMIDNKMILYTNIGRIKYHKRLFNEALEHFQFVYNTQLQNKTIDYSDLVQTINYLGLIYLEQKKYDQAFDYHFYIIKVDESHSNIPKLFVANSNNTIGVILAYKHDYVHALEYLFRAMKLYETYPTSNDHLTMAANYNSIGLVYYYLKQYNEALNYCLKALNIRERILPMNHSFIADSCNNIALIYHNLNSYEKAVHLLQRAVKIFQEDSNYKMQIAMCFNNIGLLYSDQHEYDQAIEYHSKALSLYNNDSLRREEISYTLYYLGFAYEMKSDFKNSLIFYQKALKHEVENSERFVKILIKIASIYQNTDDYELALVHYQNAIDKSEFMPVTLLSSVLLAMGTIYTQQNRKDSAFAIYNRALSIQKYSSSNKNLDLAAIYYNMGCLYEGMDKLKCALKCQRKALSIRRSLSSSTHLDLIANLTSLGRIYYGLAMISKAKTNEYNKALKYFKLVVDIQEKSLPSNHHDIALSYYYIGLIYMSQKKYKQAIVTIQKALNIQKSSTSCHKDELEKIFDLQERIQKISDDQIESLKRTNHQPDAN